MPDIRRTTCRHGCGKHRDEVGLISWRGLCVNCATEHVAENVIGLATMSGPAVPRWRQGMAACVGAVLPDEARARGIDGQAAA